MSKSREKIENDMLIKFKEEYKIQRYRKMSPEERLWEALDISEFMRKFGKNEENNLRNRLQKGDRKSK